MLEVQVKASRGDFELDVAFDVRAGITALIGASGAGKSTLLRLICGLDRPSDGKVMLGEKIWFDGSGQKGVPPHKRQIGMVFQTGLLLSHRNVLDNILLGARGHEIDTNLLEQTGCLDLLDRPVGGLSGGEQQRVMLARALVGRPKLLLLDEPLSALDPVSREKLQTLMVGLFPKLNIPIIYVTHAFEEAVRLASNFLRMDSGKIIAHGGAREVLSYSSVGGQELAVSSLVAGRICLSDKGVARVQVGEQFIDISSGNYKKDDQVNLRLWARDLILARQKPIGLSARNCIRGQIYQLQEVAYGQVLVDVIFEGRQVSALVLGQTVKDMGLKIEQPIFLIFKSASVESIAADSGRAKG